MPASGARWRRATRSARLRAADAADRLSGGRDRLTPPRRLRELVGDSDFDATGREFLGHFTALAGLTADDRVLDVGCGSGRMARPLADVLRPPGSYDGFDVSAQAIAWCAAHYDRTPAPFRFVHADLHNSTYNPRGLQMASRYTFPYADASFDLAVATSVFTHLLADEADRYLAEIARVLAPGGRLLSSWFLLAEERPPTADAAFAFGAWDGGPASVADPGSPAAAVAFPESWLGERLASHGLRQRGPVRLGSWSGREGLSFQDIVVAAR